jgi:hypothetical protein
MGTETWALEPSGWEHGERVVDVDRTKMDSPNGCFVAEADHSCYCQ